MAPSVIGVAETLGVAREQVAEALADLKLERGSVRVRASIAESEVMPLRYRCR
jgi:hypothetical protein